MKIDPVKKQIILDSEISIKELKKLMKESNLSGWKKYNLVWQNSFIQSGVTWGTTPTHVGYSTLTTTRNTKPCTITKTNDIIN